MKNLAGPLIVTSLCLIWAGISHGQDQAKGKKLYLTYCAGCHGTSGKGDGPAAKSLPVKPADHTRAAMNKYSDHFLIQVISKGGASVGKASEMPAWSTVLREQQIQDIVAHIRTLSPTKKPVLRAPRPQDE